MDIAGFTPAGLLTSLHKTLDSHQMQQVNPVDQLPLALQRLRDISSDRHRTMLCRLWRRLLCQRQVHSDCRQEDTLQGNVSCKEFRGGAEQGKGAFQTQVAGGKLAPRESLLHVR